MIDIILTDTGRWMVYTKNDEFFLGSEKDAKQFLLDLGVKQEDIDIASSEMAANGAKGAHFGIYLTFIMTLDSGLKGVA